MMQKEEHPSKERQVQYWHNVMASIASRMADIRDEEASKNPCKRTLWEAAMAHNGAAGKHARAGDMAKHDHHVARKIEHLSAHKKAST